MLSCSCFQGKCSFHQSLFEQFISCLLIFKDICNFSSDNRLICFVNVVMYMDNWIKSLEMMNKWMICNNGFPFGFFAEGNIYSKGAWTFRCHGWHCWLFGEPCSAGMLNSRWNRFLWHQYATVKYVMMYMQEPVEFH